MSCTSYLQAGHSVPKQFHWSSGYSYPLDTYRTTCASTISTRTSNHDPHDGRTRDLLESDTQTLPSIPSPTQPTCV